MESYNEDSLHSGLFCCIVVCMVSPRKKLNTAILKKHGVALALAFGSAVTGNRHPGSDVDVGILFSDPGVAKREPVAVYDDLRRAFSAVFPGETIDIAYLHEAPLSLQFRAAIEGIVLYEAKQTTFADFREYAMKRYFDFAFFEDIMNEPFRTPQRV